jgi:hypothetical protein
MTSLTPDAVLRQIVEYADGRFSPQSDLARQLLECRAALKLIHGEAVGTLKSFGHRFGETPKLSSEWLRDVTRPCLPEESTDADS